MCLLSSHRFSAVRIIQSLVFSVVFCGSVPLAIVLSFRLQFTASANPSAIFKPFLVNDILL